jgi:hypothetical protein
MRNVSLQIDDNIYNNMMFILNSLKRKGLKIVENKQETTNQTTKHKTLKEFLDTNKTDVFRFIDDPMQWQKNQRDEWK